MRSRRRFGSAVVADEPSSRSILTPKELEQQYALTPAIIKKLKREGLLKYLKLGGTTVTDGGTHVLAELPLLEVLDLNTTEVGDQTLSYVANLQLTDLNLSGSRITSEGLKYLSSMTSLRTLNLSGTQIDDEGVAHLASLTNLRTLLVTNTSITDEGLKHLRGLHGLRFLSLTWTAVTEEGIHELLRQLPELDELAVAPNQISEFKLNELKTAIPTLKVYDR